jgi:hypothetical protein
MLFVSATAASLAVLVGQASPACHFLTDRQDAGLTEQPRTGTPSETPYLRKGVLSQEPASYSWPASIDANAKRALTSFRYFSASLTKSPLDSAFSMSPSSSATSSLA